VLENKVVVITGSGQGIGKHAAMTFAKEKAKVVIADFNAELAKKTAEFVTQAFSAALHARGIATRSQEDALHRIYNLLRPGEPGGARRGGAGRAALERRCRDVGGHGAGRPSATA